MGVKVGTIAIGCRPDGRRLMEKAKMEMIFEDDDEQMAAKFQYQQVRLVKAVLNCFTTSSSEGGV
jgi:hypothetical protein